MSRSAPPLSGHRADPRLVAVHRAVRAAVVTPAVFAVCLLVLHDVQVATFAVFGCFALLVMADFGGPRPARALAYAATTMVGACLVALGTVASPNAGVGAAVMLAVGFTLAFAGVFGGYLTAAQTAASYAASAIGFVTGQAAFTLTVIILFNLVSPVGWQVGLVRIEDVLVGTAISVVAGMILWPRGARRDLARATAGYYRAILRYLEHAFDAVLHIGSGADVAHDRAEAVRARDRAGEAFEVFLNERGAKPLDPHTAGRLLSAGNQALLGGDLLVMVAADLGYRANACPDGVATVEAGLQLLARRVGYLADELTGTQQHGERPQPPSVSELRAAATACMQRSGGDEAATHGAMAVVIAAEWVQNLSQLERDLDQAVEAAVAAAGVPWWR